MTNRKTTKKALIFSALSLLLCFSMLVGTTFAWFTDSVTSTGNIIQSGTLIVALDWADGKADPANDATTWTDASAGQIFKNDKWEPGYTEARHLKISNEGTLALKYELAIIPNGTVSALADVIDVYYLDPAEQVADRTALKNMTPVGTLRDLINGGICAGSLEAGKNQIVTIVLKMQETAGNEYQDKSIGTDFAIQLLATQMTFEADSFGPDYDYAAPPVMVKTQEELANALTAGLSSPVSIKLMNDIELTGEWAPIGNKDEGVYFTGTFDGNGHEISGLTVTGGDYVALIGAAKDATIKNLTVSGTVAGENPAGIAARVEGATVIENCVSNVDVTGSTKVGGIACNVTNTNPATTVIKNCVNNGDVTVSGNAKAGGIVGYVNNDGTLKIDNCVNNGAITGTTNAEAGAAIGWAAGTSSGLIVNFKNTGDINGKNWLNDGRYLAANDGTVLAAYCATPANWDVSYSVDKATIQDAFADANGSDIKKKISGIVFGKPADYPEIVSNYTATVTDGVSVYQVPDGENYTVYYLSDSKISAPANSMNLFADMSAVTEIDVSNLDMSQVENAVCMFLNCTNLEKLDTANWDTSNMTNMQSLFYGCNKLEDIDVSNWDTSNVTNMRMVFFRCYELPNDVLKGVENWDVSNVSNFYSMFKHARGLTDLDLSKWDTSSATNMSHMFANIGGVQTLDLSSFDTSKVTDMSWMFYDASKLTTIYVGDGWTTEALDPAKPTCFYNNQLLVGGAGTTWLDVCDMANPSRPWESSAKLDYAIVDGGTSNPGLLTYKAN